MKTKPTVTIGIPAYNEENNIGALIKALLSQKQKDWKLDRIIVVSDQSTDRTDKIVKSFKRKVVLYRNRKRKGTALNQNVIVSKNKSDILVLLDADVLPTGSLFISHLVRKFTSNKVGLVGGRVVPLGGNTFFERIINHSVEIKQSLYESINKGDNLYLCHGRVRAFSKQFTKKFKWIPTFGEDAFSYLSCINLGYKFKYAPNAVVHYRSPQNLADHTKQSVRFLKGNSREKKYFDKELVDREYYIPTYIFINTVLKYLIENPVYTILYFFVFLYAEIRNMLGEKINTTWDMSLSSKKL